MDILGIDVGGVLIDRIQADGSDTSFFSDRYLETPSVPGAFEAVARLAAKRFGPNVHIVSKCGPRTEAKTLAWLAHHAFHERTSLPVNHVHFCRERRDKAPICKRLGVTHFIDDRADVLSYLETVPNLFLFGPQPRGAAPPARAVRARTGRRSQRNCSKNRHPIGAAAGRAMLPPMSTTSFNQKLHDALHGDPETPFMEFKGRVFKRSEIGGYADKVLALLSAAGVPPHASVGVLVRNRPLHTATMLGLLAGDRWLTSIYANQSPESVAEDFRTSKFAAVVADAQDWSPLAVEALAEVGGVGIILELGNAAEPIKLHPALAKLGAGPFRQVADSGGMEILSSGTTGKPKRVVFPSKMLAHLAESMSAGVGLQPEPNIMPWPYGSVGGMSNLVADPVTNRYTVLLEKFDANAWADAVEKYKISSSSASPTTVRMILDAKIPKEKIKTLKMLWGGSAAMTPDLQREVERTYGVDVVWAYGATEFCGTVISWSPDLYRQYRDTKIGAMGKAVPGIKLRATDPVTGEEVPPNTEGYLEGIVPAMGDHWIKTTDLVRIDEDGFIFHLGRGDGAIIRGGHKVLPERVIEALREHPAVMDAAVVGIPDARLGAVPVAVVELKTGVATPSEDALKDQVRKKLKSTEIPTQVLVLAALPRTPTMKPDLGAIKRLFEA